MIGKMIKRFFKKRRAKLQTYSHYVAVCAIVKDEDPYLEEWIAHNKQIGVTQFYLYDNESSIPLRQTLDKYIKQGLVQVIDFPGRAVQMIAYKHFLDSFKSECQWTAFIDIDEYIVPKSTNGNLIQFLKSYENHGGLAVNWLVFGSNGQKAASSKPQVQRFRKRGLKTEPVNEHIKSIIQTRYVENAGGNPHEFPYINEMFCVNENRERILTATHPHSTNLIQINHYMTRSLEEYQNKVSRGRADTTTIMRKMDDFNEAEAYANIITDETLIELQMILNKKQFI